MRAFIVQNVARQVEGDLMLVQVEKGFADRAGADGYLASLPKQSVQTIKTEMGSIECFCVRGVYEVEIILEGEEANGETGRAQPA